MRHRIFIAVNLPENVKKKLIFEQEKIESQFASLDYENKISPIRWVKLDNLHITLLFLGYISDQEIPEICRLAKIIGQKQEPFSIHLHRICLGPPNKFPKMVWVGGEKNQELADLKDSLERELLNSENSGYAKKEVRAFSPHITLGRIRQWQWRRIEPEERPEIAKEISLTFDVNSIEVMESQLKPKGPEYAILESASLADSKNF